MSNSVTVFRTAQSYDVHIIVLKVLSKAVTIFCLFFL